MAERERKGSKYIYIYVYMAKEQRFALRFFFMVDLF